MKRLLCFTSSEVTLTALIPRYLLQVGQGASRHRLQGGAGSLQDGDEGEAQQALQQQPGGQARQRGGRGRGHRQSFLFPGG